MLRIGLDIGSTTLKCAVLDENSRLIHKSYERHFSRIKEKCAEVLSDLHDRFPNEKAALTISGSAGMGLADSIGVQFVQEVYATRSAVMPLLRTRAL